MSWQITYLFNHQLFMTRNSNKNTMNNDNACVSAKSLQSCLTLCKQMDCNPLDSSVQGFHWKNYWSGLPCPPLGDLPDPGIKPVSFMSPALAGEFCTASSNNDNIHYLFIVCYVLNNMLGNFVSTIAFNSSDFPITKIL